MSEEVRFGVIGCGVIGTVHAEVLQSVRGARLVAVADAVPEAAKKVAERYGVAWYQDYREMLARADIDAVTIGTPSGMHAEQAIEAARAGKHVLTEKPMAIHLADADRMIVAAQKAGVRLGVIFQNRFHRDVMRLYLAVQRGAFGRPVLGNALVRWWRTQEYFASARWRGTWALDGGGALMNQSIHYVDLLQWCMGPVEQVFAYTNTLAHEIETEDVATAVVRFRSGALGIVEGTTAANPGFSARLDIHGDRGGASIEDNRLVECKVAEDGGMPPEDDSELAGTYVPEPGAPWWKAHLPIFQMSVNAILEGKPMPVSGEEGRKSVEIILAIYQSARTGQPVTLPLQTG